MCNFIDGLQYKINTLSEVDFQSLVEKIKLEIDAPFILGSGNLETVFFTIRIQDREEEWSNDISTPLISVSR